MAPNMTDQTQLPTGQIQLHQLPLLSMSYGAQALVQMLYAGGLGGLVLAPRLHWRQLN